jgi:hypothetical protein
MTDRDKALEFVGLIARMTINEEKDADGEVFYQDPFEAIGVLGELIATARQIAAKPELLEEAKEEANDLR